MLRTIMIVLQFIVPIALIAVVALQPSKSEGLGAMGGNSSVFYNKSRGIEAFLEKATTWLAVIFLILTILFVVIK